MWGSVICVLMYDFKTYHKFDVTRKIVTLSLSCLCLEHAAEPIPSKHTAVTFVMYLETVTAQAHVVISLKRRSKRRKPRWLSLFTSTMVFTYKVLLTHHSLIYLLHIFFFYFSTIRVNYGNLQGSTNKNLQLGRRQCQEQFYFKEKFSFFHYVQRKTSYVTTMLETQGFFCIAFNDIINRKSPRTWFKDTKRPQNKIKKFQHDSYWENFFNQRR